MDLHRAGPACIPLANDPTTGNSSLSTRCDAGLRANLWLSAHLDEHLRDACLLGICEDLRVGQHGVAYIADEVERYLRAICIDPPNKGV